MAELLIPPPEAGDGEDVHWALTTAASLHARGDYPEALRWLRRAVASAVASSNDGRAIELGRRAAELEEALSAASTDRSRDTMPEEVDAAAQLAHNNKTLRVDSRPVPFDGLDEVTYVDPPDEITHIPFTQKAAGMEHPRGTPLPPEVFSTIPEAGAVTRDALGMNRYPSEEETTVAMKGAPVMDEPSSDTGPPHTAVPPAVEPRRVALLASADGDARIIPLSPGSQAPDGSAVALLFPVTKQDAHRIAHLLGTRRPPRS
jgi:hypothetical protein